MKRWIGAALIAGAAACAFASPTMAKGPTRTHEHLPSFRLPGGICGFPILVRPLVDRGIIKTYPDGHVTITGALKESMTNLRNGHSITVNTSGPVRIVTTAHDIITYGRGSSWIAQFGPGDTSFLVQTHGQVISDLDGVRLVHGTSRDLCPVLR